MLLYDLTSTYFESDPPFPEGDKRRYGYSRDKRSDCVQVVIALIVTPEGFPLAYEVLSGNTADKTTLRDFLAKIQKQYGQAQRIWVMDRGIPTEEVLAEMRASAPPVSYVVGTPKGRLSQLSARLVEQDWRQVHEGVEVKLVPKEGEIYVLAQSRDRINKERAMRRRQLKGLWQRLKELRQMKRLNRDGLLLKLGAAKSQAPAAWRLVEIEVPARAGAGAVRGALEARRARHSRLCGVRVGGTKETTVVSYPAASSASLRFLNTCSTWASKSPSPNIKKAMTTSGSLSSLLAHCQTPAPTVQC